MSQAYRGIDFANHHDHLGSCVVVDDGITLTAQFAPDQVGRKDVAVTAIDCPLGTSRGFESTLRGELCEDHGKDGCKTRFTERHLRTVGLQYLATSQWIGRTESERELYPRKSYFNGGSHIQPSVGLVIVPECIQTVGRMLCPEGSPEERLKLLQKARRGEGPIVEAHPRMFLYSAIQRVGAALGKAPVAVLEAAGGYKDKNEAGTERRKKVYDYLSQNSQWMHPHERRLAIEGSIADLVMNDHAFDAWLAAMTAWAHSRGLTSRWDQIAGFAKEMVDVEGHILVLRG